MSFSFIDIEEEKSRVIFFAFIFIILIYFLTAYLLLLVIENSFNSVFLSEQKNIILFPPLKHILIALGAAVLAAFLHWSFSTSNLIPKMSLAVGAEPIDPKDTYHQYFKSIVDEVSVAIGGRQIEPVVIRASYMNAFSLNDFEGQAVIGITEGLLSRLNRAQIEAVVAHEAGHIASGDCLNATVLCSLGELYEEGLLRVKSGLKQVRGRPGLFLFFVFLVLSLMEFLSKALRSFLSRQRELRADAVAVRLTRNPLSLAEALKLISRNWKGQGLPGESLQSIFIVNPQFDELDENEGIFSDLFSTHPPVKNRVDVLLSMAHLDEITLEENLKNFVRVSPVAKPEFRLEPEVDASLVANKWFIFKDAKWEGPFGLDELKSFSWLLPTMWIKPEDSGQIKMAYDDEGIKGLFSKSVQQERKEFICPHCKTALQEINYEGAPVLKCSYCQGIFVDDDKISRILIREDYAPSEEVKRLAKVIIESKDKLPAKNYHSNPAWFLNCPKCKAKMHRQLFVYSYPVEIDRCISCSGLWFDKSELEILQYIYQEKRDILYKIEPG